jgi:hypothetical protein
LLQMHNDVKGTQNDVVWGKRESGRYCTLSLGGGSEYRLGNRARSWESRLSDESSMWD